MSPSPTTEPVSSSTPSGDAGDVEAIDRSCRFPVLLLILGGVKWLALALVFAFLAGMNFHKSGGLFPGCSWLTYGHLYPAFTNSLVFGFAIPTALGVALWLLCRLGKTPLAGGGVIVLASCFWFLGVLVGVIAILAGATTGFEGLEMPAGAAGILFASYAVIGACALITFRNRTTADLAVSQWFILAAVLWFPWIYSTAIALLHCAPVRGVMQAVVAWWFASNLHVVALGGFALAVLFYFIPRFAGRPLQNQGLAKTGFWTFVFTAPLLGMPDGAPIPAWLPSLSTFAAFMMVVPLAAILVNFAQTLAGGDGARALPGALRKQFSGEHDWDRKFVFASMYALLLWGVLLTIGPLLEVLNNVAPLIFSVTPFVDNASGPAFTGAVDLTRLTLFHEGMERLFLFGFVGMAFMGAAYYIVPRIAGEDLPMPTLINVHFWLTAGGVALLVLTLIVGGLRQGYLLYLAQAPFNEVAASTVFWLRIGFLGELALLVGTLAFAVNLKVMIWRRCRACCRSCFARAVSVSDEATEVSA